MAADDWKNTTFRQNVLSKLDELVAQCQPPLNRNIHEIEAQMFSKFNNKEEYVAQITKIFTYIKNNKKVGGVMPGVNNSAGIQKTLGQNQQNVAPMGVGGNVASNLLQTLNQRPAQQMQQPMHNKMPGMNMLQNQQMHMNQMQNMNNSMMPQMNQMSQGNMGAQMGPQPVQQHVTGPPMGPNQLQQAVQNHMQNQMQNQITGHQLSGGPMNPAMQSTMQPQQSPSQQQQHMNQMNSPHMNVNQMSQQQLGHMQRKPIEVMNAVYTGQRNLTPNQFMNQSPSSSAPSPGGLGAPGSQMVPSPALVPSPSNPHMLGGPRSLSMAPSPSSSLNTPAGIIGGAVASPVQDDSQACREKIQKLRKFVEPLNNYILKMAKDGFTEKTIKMQKLLEILTSPNNSTNLELLKKCEIALEKMDFKYSASTGPALPSNLKEYQFFTPLLEVVTNLLNHNSIPNHTLNKTFGPCVEALFGPEIKNLPPPLKKQKIEEIPREIPDVLQGEIARLDQRFKISLDPTQQIGAKNILLICWLDDKHLPCVPPVSITVPGDYPTVPPKCVLSSHEYATPYLSAVQKALNARLDKFPNRFSISQVLDAWEASVRQACSPNMQQEEKVVNPIMIPSTAQIPTVSSNPVTNGIPPSLIVNTS